MSKTMTSVPISKDLAHKVRNQLVKETGEILTIAQAMDKILKEYLNEK